MDANNTYTGFSSNCKAQLYTLRRSQYNTDRDAPTPIVA
jgi:hypothetical protein